MKTKSILVLAALLAALLPGGTVAAEAAAGGKGIRYNMPSKQVAKKIRCKGATNPGGGGAKKFHIRDSVVCLLGLKRVNVITFRDRVGQTRWEDYMIVLATIQGYPQHWASANGVAIVAKNGNAGAACAGEAALKGAKKVNAYEATEYGWTYLAC